MYSRSMTRFNCRIQASKSCFFPFPTIAGDDAVVSIVLMGVSVSLSSLLLHRDSIFSLRRLVWNVGRTDIGRGARRMLLHADTSRTLPPPFGFVRAEKSIRVQSRTTWMIAMVVLVAIVMVKSLFLTPCSKGKVSFVTVIQFNSDLNHIISLLFHREKHEIFKSIHWLYDHRTGTNLHSASIAVVQVVVAAMINN